MTFFRRALAIIFLAGSIGIGVVRAEDLTLPTFRTYAGAFLASRNHNFFVESDLQLPLLRVEPFGLYYRHRETTPFLDLPSHVQAELLYSRDEIQVDYHLADSVRLIGLAGYDTVHLTDRPGLSTAFAVGGGIGSPLRADGDRLHWYALAGGYQDRSHFDADWWTDLYGSYRIMHFLEDDYLGSTYRASGMIAAHVETANQGRHVRPLYRVGPELQFLTSNGNRANLQFQWYDNDDNFLFGKNENGFLFGLEVASSRDDRYIFHGLEQRQPGWFPMTWGAYDQGFSRQRHEQRFEMNVEVVDFMAFQHRVTHFIWYESRQEYRSGDFDNISYSVTLGLQTPLDLASPFPPSDQLVAGVDFLHRSDHALNPDAARVAAVGIPTSLGPKIDNGSINLIPRFRLQSLGWDLPYRDPAMYDLHTAWLGYLDWRLTAGFTSISSRDRGLFAGQVGANLDVATVQGFVVYTRGIASYGNETPDWLAELGLRRPAGKLFARYESYGVNHNIARGNTFVLGVGVNL